MTPSRKPSRATVITASIAIGVFGAGAGLGTVIAARSQPPAEQSVRLAAGTYHLDELAQAWKAGEAPSLSGSDAGSTISKKGPLGTALAGAKVCLTATADGHAVSGSAGGCIGLPVLASATAPLQRPSNPKSGTAKDTKDAKDTAPKAAPQPTVKPVKNDAPPKSNTGGGGGGGGGGGTTQKAPVSAPVQPPKTNTKADPPPPPPTKKVSGGISDNGSVIDKPATLAEKPKLGIGADAPKVADRDEKPQPDSPKPPKAAKPTGALKPALPNGTAKPVTPPKTTAKQKPQNPVNQPQDAAPKSSDAAPKTSDAAPKSSGKHHPDAQSAPETTETTDENGEAFTPEQEPDQTVLQPAPMGAGVETLPVFKDPELLKRAQEALGLDKNMRYTDENGVWDLNIAPPGTPPCRDYTEDELRELGADQDGAVIPRDSCRWPAFVRWLYAEPAPGEVSNWTKFTGLPERNLEFVVTDQAPAQSPQAPAQPEQQQPDQNDQYDPYGQDDQPGQQGQPDQQNQQGQNGEYGQQPPAQPDKHDQSGGLVPAQPQPDQQTSHSKQQRRETPSDAGPYETRRYIKNGPGQVEPDQDGPTGP
ncbi:hypothetical protein ABT340_34240 [Streptosporangium sp. NPDC000239]|uniref:hypothetical protein n=1 Tax=Streptosporangium sp. NPDC000239 TaxID=3154248 RepID=UPI00332C2A4E